MPVVTHVERMARLRAEIDRECIRRWEKLTGDTFRESARITYPADLAHEDYRRSREIEDVADQHWRNLDRVVRQCEKFLTDHKADAGAFKAAQLAKVVPQIVDMMKCAPFEVGPGGAAALSDKPPSRRTFIRDRLRLLAKARGLSDPLDLPPQTIAVFTLLSRAFFPYSHSAERRFEKDGYPTAAAVIRKEVESVRKLLKR